MNTITVSEGSWTQLGTGLTVCVLQFMGDGEVYVDVSAPTSTDTGWFIKSGEPVEVPRVSELGGGVWVRSCDGSSGITYAVA